VDETKPPEQPEPSQEPAEVPPRKRRLRRVLLRLLAVVVAVVAAILVTVFTVDLGPSLRERAEREGTKYMERPIHIGRLSAKLTPGEFLVEDLLIEGLTPQDRPFLKAKQITVRVPWWTVFTRKLVVESVTMTDWDMVVESWPGGRHNFPKVTPKTRRTGPPAFTTTLRSVLATRGQFTYDDHGTPWSTVARNLTVELYRSDATNDYRGRTTISNGTVQIQSYQPFRMDMQSRFSLSNGKVHFDHMDLLSDGARTAVTGDVDLARWPEQLYQLRSRIDFPTQKNIFFHGQKFAASGVGDFTGSFHLFKGGRELKGSFVSPLAGVNDWRFPNLRGSVLWLPDRLEITNATSELYGGTARFDYRMAPFGRPTPARATWDVQYTNVDLETLSDFLETEGLRLAGRASGRNRLEWPLGKWALKTGQGEVTVAAPPDTRPMTRELPADLVAELTALPEEAGPFNPQLSLGHVPIAGHIVYSLDPEWIRLEKSWTATSRTYVEFQGQTAFGEQSRIPFHVTSLDWQESDRVLAGIMTAFGSRTGAVQMGGYGEFDGVLLEAFKRPRIQGTLKGERFKAWDVVWGTGRADLAIENSYVFVSNATLTEGDSEIRADGQFSLGFPRRDGGDEIDARVRVTRRPLVDLRHAFNLDDYPVEGTVSGEYQLYGKYQTPFGFGRLNIEKGTAYGETFDVATSSLRFEGAGIRLDNIDIKKSTGGVTGAAYVGWDGTYSFNADGARIPVESLVSVRFPRAPLSGRLQFTATGAGTFDEPRYDVKRLAVDDFFAGDEGIGQLLGNLNVRGDLLTLDLEVSSPRLVISGLGRIALTPEMDAELSVRFRDTSLDPYVRFFEPRLSPFTTAIVGGTMRVLGELANLDQLVVDTRVEQLDLKLFDYRVRNDGAIELTLDQNILEIGRFRLAGEGTQLQLDGQLGLKDQTIDVQATGDANLGILQGFFRDLRSRGTAELKAQMGGTFKSPIFAGSATLTEGRLRHFSLPHSLESINGKVSFDASGVRVDEVTGRLGGGTVTFGGRIGLNGFALGDLSLTATGERMSVRYPEGFRSIIDADLALQGTTSALVLNGNVVVQDGVWSRRIETSPDIFNLAGGSSIAPGSGAAAPTLPLRFDVGITAASSLRIQNNIANMVASADLRLQGTYDRPLLFGRAEIERGDVLFEGNRYIVTPGGSIDFFNPSRIEPFFELEAETRVRRPGQPYRLTIGLSGTMSRFSYALNSDPPLPEVDIISLVFGQNVDLQDAELRALRSNAAQQSEEALLKEGFTRMLLGPISTPVGRALGEAFGIDTVQITPTLGNETDSLTPSARVVIGKRISNRAYLTFARALGNSSSSRDQVIVLEYDQNERLGWVVTQLGDGTFALDFRVRHRF
jgi:hypothetical protein